MTEKFYNFLSSLDSQPRDFYLLMSLYYKSMVRCNKYEPALKNIVVSVLSEFFEDQINTVLFSPNDLNSSDHDEET